MDNKAIRTAVVIENRLRYGGYADLVLKHDEIARSAQPGQFVMIKAHQDLAPILGRPFDIADTDPAAGKFRLIIKPQGKGTELMKRLTVGAPVPVLGPLGNGIDFSSFQSIAVLVRGVGAAAVTFLVKRAEASGCRCSVFLSANTADRLVCSDDFERSASDLFIATDDGSRGFQGNATELMEDFLAGHSVDAVYTCGSRRFARYVDALDTRGLAEGYVFLEGYMACGVGSCHGCAVKKRKEEGYFLVCSDGPVFKSSEVVLE